MTERRERARERAWTGSGRAAAVVAALAWVACGGGERAGGDGLTGTVAVDGSSTVYPITEAVAEEFQRAHPDVRVTVGISGTGGGFKKFCAGETDISDASRAITDGEREECERNGIRPIELPVAWDGITVVVNPQNDWAECVTVDELRRIWQPGSTIRRWNQVRSGWPDTEMVLYGPDTDSGTFDYFTEAVMGEERASRSEYTASADDNVLVVGVAGDRGALGYFGYAYYEENADRLKALEVDGGEGCVRPDRETIRDGSYQPLSRLQYIYVREASLDRPEVRAFVDFYLGNAEALVPEVGYVPLAAERYREGLERLPEPAGAAEGAEAGPGAGGT